LLFTSLAVVQKRYTIWNHTSF